MPRKHTHKINRGGGPETEIQANIREELERIFCILTLDKTVRKAYTKSSILETTSNGAKLIDALRDLYSSKSMKGSEKATKRNELVVRIIKLVIDEPSIFRQHKISPVEAGYQHQMRFPVILPKERSLLFPIEGYALMIPSLIFNTLGQCAGNVFNICRLISDDEAYENLRTVTSEIKFSENGQPLFDLYNDVKGYFDSKDIVEFNPIARIIFKKLFNSNIDANYSGKFEPSIAHLIQRTTLLYFISILYYYIVGQWQQKLEYDDNYTRHVLETIRDVRDDRGDEDMIKSPLHRNAGGANLQHRKKTSKKQRRHKRSTLLLKKK
jgi:hypothetical protein